MTAREQAATPFGRLDSEALRRRLKKALGRESAGPAPAIREGSQRSAPKTAAPPVPDIGGQEIENELGRFIMQEHLFPYSRMHGRFPIQRLGAMSPEWVRDISQGELSPAASERWAFLDTETTGLAGGTGTHAFLVGVGSIENQGFRVRLFFMRDFDEEAAMLKALAQHLSRYEVVLTYNGKTFDAPLLETRFRMQRQRNPLAEMGHVDLLHPARRLWSERMSNCRLGTLESEILGFKRRGDVPGFLIPQRYFEFLRTRRGAGLKPVFFHNVRDIVSLACLGSVVMSSYSDPVKAPLRHGRDLMGLARWLARTRRDEVALRLYRSAIQAGLPPSCLAPCLLGAAKIERRLRNPGAQVELLRDLLQIPEVCHLHRVEALEALAKHYEHIERDYARALDHTRAAQRHAPSESLSHRENRLLRKIASAELRAASG